MKRIDQIPDEIKNRIKYQPYKNRKFTGLKKGAAVFSILCLITASFVVRLNLGEIWEKSMSRKISYFQGEKNE